MGAMWATSGTNVTVHVTKTVKQWTIQLHVHMKTASVFMGASQVLPMSFALTKMVSIRCKL